MINVFALSQTIIRLIHLMTRPCSPSVSNVSFPPTQKHGHSSTACLLPKRKPAETNRLPQARNDLETIAKTDAENPWIEIDIASDGTTIDGDIGVEENFLHIDVDRPGTGQRVIGTDL